MNMWRRFLRWAGFLHEGPYRVRPKHWWQWRRANRVERYVNWKMCQPAVKVEMERALLESLLCGSWFGPPPSGFYGLGIGDLLGEDNLKRGDKPWWT